MPISDYANAFFFARPRRVTLSFAAYAFTIAAFPAKHLQQRRNLRDLSATASRAVVCFRKSAEERRSMAEKKQKPGTRPGFCGLLLSRIEARTYFASFAI